MHKEQWIEAGQALDKAAAVLIMVHGRGGSAADIISLASNLQVKDMAILAPQATNHTWYPYSFMAPVHTNEPWLTSALAILKNKTDELLAKGFSSRQLFFLGFSQGACLTLEFVARHANEYGGVIAFTGGLIGETLDKKNYTGNFQDTPIFIGSSDTDPHVPVSRVNETEEVLSEKNAIVRKKIYPGMGHTIIGDEINEANKILSQKIAG